MWKHTRPRLKSGRAEPNDLSKAEKTPRPGHAYGKETAEKRNVKFPGDKVRV